MACLFAVWNACDASGQATQRSDQALGADAAAARDRGDTTQAVSLYRQALSLNPRWQDGWWFLGNLEYSTDRYAEARDSLSEYIRLLPDATAAFALRGLSEFEIGLYEDSLNDIHHALSLGAANKSRNKEILLYHEAMLLTRLGRFEEASTKYAVFVKEGTVNPDVLLGLGLAGLRMPILPSVVKLEDTDLLTRAGSAAVAILGGDVAGGRRAFQELSVAYPNRPFLHYFCGYLVFPADPDQAVAEFNLELKDQTQSSMAYAMLAWIAELRGDFTGALPNAEKAAEEQPGVAMNELVLGRALVETNELTAGIEHLDRAVQLEPGNIDAHLSLGKTYSRMGRKDDARRERLLCLQLSGTGVASLEKP